MCLLLYWSNCVTVISTISLAGEKKVTDSEPAKRENRLFAGKALKSFLIQEKHHKSNKNPQFDENKDNSSRTQRKIQVKMRKILTVKLFTSPTALERLKHKLKASQALRIDSSLLQWCAICSINIRAWINFKSNHCI